MGLDMWMMNTSKEKELAYWRKANQIRHWFAVNLDEFCDNGSTHVEKEDLEKLESVCNDVLNDRSKAISLLPPSNGFFFGSTEIDEWYFDDVQYTAEVLKDIIESTDWENDEIQYCEWY